MNSCIKDNKDCACCEILCKEAIAEHNKNIDQLKKELEQERVKVRKMRNSGNCSLVFTDSCPFYAYNQTNCPCIKWKLKE